MQYQGSCHCGDVSFSFEYKEKIASGLRCDCSLCKRKGALMTDFVLAPDELQINAKDDALGLYEFGSGVAKHFFCKRCGIYPFHQTLRKPGHYRVNLGCVDSINTQVLKESWFEGSKL